MRTWPARATRLTFFVIGDYGDGGAGQRGIAAAMTAEFFRREAAGEAVRFVLAVGDNIYASANSGYLIRGSGADDRDWERKILRAVTEDAGADPVSHVAGEPAGAVAPLRLRRTCGHFRAGQHGQYCVGASGAGVRFGRPAIAMAQAPAESRAPWKIPYFHHPPFNAGSEHGASYGVLRHWAEWFGKAGVRVVFTGHEHNYQFNEASQLTGGAHYFVSGAGGELRPGNVLANMTRAHIEGWAPARLPGSVKVRL